ncbi:cold shock and DUF1294 domain-containing protein [Scytonema hofmannii FACHB-248]|uniref:Cold shock and DUF1294 domain-containing protein n=1 Tax=Scytonema hofmannii FACHB-248 TaxID=1842502 RepID=A0ABR8GXB0_9CYAN|nr:MULTISPECIES: cold shock and DUF1294 domain-containing protein [Nostocales]MBD2608028.1 cold shock and DUF1294 domain-containing protein [Scytonema hofmannii FACHB-248]
MKPVWHKGKLTTWKDDKGFGFIRSSDGSQDVFLHITALKETNHRPQVDDVICYQLTVDKDGRIHACNASIEGVVSKPMPIISYKAIEKETLKPKAKSSLILEVLLLSLLPGLGAMNFALTTFNPIPLILYPVMSFLTFTLYADDKSRAKQGRWRVSERTLHLCEFMGGWLGAFIAQRRLRHKSRKVSYQIVFWVIVAIHIIFWLNWLFFGKKLLSLFFGIVFRA